MKRAFFALVLALPHLAAATPHQAHLHYMVGVRAYAGTRHAAMLHHEAASDGLDAALARDNAASMLELASEIGVWLDRIDAAQPAAEKVRIAAEMAAMRQSTRSARKLALDLREILEPVSGEPAPAVRHSVTAHCRSLFTLFKAILDQHKRAEAELGIPVPPDPPPPQR